MNNSYLEGLKGEALAVRHIKKQGYKIIKTRFLSPHGEIDIIARDKGLLCFIEVKYRKNARLGEAIELYSRQKSQNILNAIKHYFSLNAREDFRIDLIEITRAGIWHIKDLEH